jgi:hypothetical protein
LAVLILLGFAMAIAGFRIDSVEPVVIGAGVAILLLSSAALLLLLYPFRTNFVTEFATLWVFGAFIVSLIYLPILAIPEILMVSAPYVLPVVALGALVENHFGKKLLLRVPAYFFFFLAPMAFFLVPTGVSKTYIEEDPLELTADLVTDKKPPFVEAPDRWSVLAELPEVGEPIEINKSAAVVSLDIAAFEEEEKAANEQRFATYAEAIAYCEAAGLAWVPSVQLVDQKVKAFADDFMAAVDTQLHHGTEELVGMQRFLESVLAAALEQQELEAAALLAGAVSLGDADFQFPDPIVEDARKQREAFLANALKSRPVGIYTRSAELAMAFRQDRFAQQLLDGALAEALERVIASDPELAEHYAWHLETRRIVTNPIAEGIRSLDRTRPPENPAHDPALFPASRSRENTLFKSVYNAPTLPDENIMNRLIRSIRAGEVDLTPEDDSGWYDHQVYALETLLVPEHGRENEKLVLTVAYKERLIEAFRTMLTKQRELHIRRIPALETAGMNYTPDYFDVSPDLHVEPTATYYLRTAKAFEFVRTSLEAHFGAAAFAAITLDDGANLGEQTLAMERLLKGLYLQVCDDIGMAPDDDAGIAMEDRPALLAEAKAWLDACADDETFKDDVRYIVPALTDANGREVRYWMTTGIRLEKVKAEYVRYPELRIGDFRLTDEVPIARRYLRFVPHEFFLPVEIFAEATGPNVPYTREEFRALCDDAGNHEAIIRAVERGSHAAPWPYALAGVAGVVIAVLLIARFRIGRGGASR